MGLSNRRAHRTGCQTNMLIPCVWNKMQTPGKPGFLEEFLSFPLASCDESTRESILSTYLLALRSTGAQAALSPRPYPGAIFNRDPLGSY
jgi:hypothetical protein